jgi:hypothetical protein
MERNKENDELVRQYRELLKKANNAPDAKKKEYYLKLASEKHDEMIVKEFEDNNFKRFSY